MSEKYSTEELVEEITVAFEARIESIDDGYTKSGDERLTKMAPTVKELTQRIKLIIIARLRAADALCKAAERARKDFDRVNELAKLAGVHPFTLTPKDLDKAIAEYDGKEE